MVGEWVICLRICSDAVKRESCYIVDKVSILKIMNIKHFSKNHLVCLALFVFCTASLFLANSASANNVAVANVSLQNINTSAKTVQIKFDLSQSNAFGDLTWDGNAFSDYLWITVKYSADVLNLPNDGYKHATLASGGTITPSSDNQGAFVKASDATTNMTVVWNYGANSVADNAIVNVKVLALETVKIPEGAFIYNAGGIGGALFNNYGGGAQATVSSVANIPTGAASGWPNGFGSFYLAKYEVSQGQYADFLNMLSTTDSTARFGATSANGYTITYTAGNAYGSRYSASVPNRASNFISWDDAKAYASWLAMRPMTEMEFEKASRGTTLGGTNTNTYPWGNTAPDTATYSYNDGSGAATMNKFFASYNSTLARPVDVGHFLRGDIARTNEQTGASPYGVTDLAGNNWEHLINCAQTVVPANGGGTVTAPASWPVASAGKGIRGGYWNGGATYLRVSDRIDAGYTSAVRYGNVGFRPTRTN